MKSKMSQPKITRAIMDLPKNQPRATDLTRAPYYHPDSIENYIEDIKALLNICYAFDYVYTKYRLKCEASGEVIYDKRIFQDYLEAVLI